MSEKSGFLGKLKQTLFRTSSGPIGGIKKILSRSGKLDQAALDDLEETFLLSDISVSATLKIMETLRSDLKRNRLENSETVLTRIKKVMVEILSKAPPLLVTATTSPTVILVVGVNGSGKTTTIGKLSRRFTQDGKKVLVAAGDTFRAAAVEQLKEWCTRSGADISMSKGNTPPSAVVYDAVHASKSKNYDVLIIDTAGRLQTKVNLMEELKKIARIIQREIPDAPHETLIVLDATTGQNAVSQVKLFNDAFPLTGIILTKLDGTAKGGAILGLVDEMKIPVKLAGFGEGIDDISDFDAETFVDALFQSDNENITEG